MSLQTVTYNLQSKPKIFVDILAEQCVSAVGTWGDVDIEGRNAAEGTINALVSCQKQLLEGTYKSAPEIPNMSSVNAEQYINETNQKKLLELQDLIILGTCYEQLSYLMSKEEPKNLETWDEQAKEIAHGIEDVMENLGTPIDQDLKRSK